MLDLVILALIFQCICTPFAFVCSVVQWDFARLSGLAAFAPLLASFRFRCDRN